MTTSDSGIQMIAGFEGFVAKPYNDVADNATNGYGHLLHLGPVDVSDPTATVYQAIEQLHKDVQIAEKAVNRLVKVSLTQNEFDALVSWTYNLGAYALASSSLLKYLNAGDYESVPAEMEKWVHAGGVAVAGLVVRRKAEAELFASK